MTVEMKNRLKTIHRNIKKNVPRIRKKLSERGVRVGEATIVSAAKYYDALNKLAKE